MKFWPRGHTLYCLWNENSNLKTSLWCCHYSVLAQFFRFYLWRCSQNCQVHWYNEIEAYQRAKANPTSQNAILLEEKFMKNVAGLLDEPCFELFLFVLPNCYNILLQSNSSAKLHGCLSTPLFIRNGIRGCSRVQDLRAVNL